MGRLPQGEFRRSSIVHPKVRRSLKEEEEDDEQLDEDEHKDEAAKRNHVVVARPDIIYHQPPEIVHRAPVVVHRPDVVIHRPPVVVHRPSVIVHKPDVILHQPPVVFNTPGPMVHQPHAVSHDMYVTHPVPEYHGSELQHVGGMTSTGPILGHVSNIGHSVSYGANECADGSDDCGPTNFGEQEFDFPVNGGNSVPFGAGMGLGGFAGGYGGGYGGYGGFGHGYGGYGGAYGGIGHAYGGFGHGYGGYGGFGHGYGAAVGRDEINEPEEPEEEQAQTKSNVEKPHKKSLHKKKEKHAKATKKQILGGGHIAVGVGGAAGKSFSFFSQVTLYRTVSYTFL